MRSLVRKFWDLIHQWFSAPKALMGTTMQIEGYTDFEIDEELGLK